MSALRFVALFASAALACSAIAQTTYDSSAPAPSLDQRASDQADPPARVARLSFVRGEVSFAPAGENDWVDAQLNRPLVTGDKLWTDANGRAELDIGATTVRMDQRTSFDFLNLADQTVQMELTQGALNVAVRRTRNGETYEVDTPTLAFVADRVGDYRIDVDPQSNATTVTVRRGAGEIYGEGGKRVAINEGQSLSFDNAQLRDYRTARVANNDEFDGFVATRDQRYDRSPSRNYVSEDVVGYKDLDDNGRWSDAPEYGHVWYPNNVAADWAPYHDGHWAWVEPWGWTWVDDAPWGFAPFHYGRWVYAESRWGWVPGPVDVRPVYAPALVAFVGGDLGVNVSIGGPIGWFALGPRDVYFPGYRCGRSYFTSINVSNARFDQTAVSNYYGGFARGNVNYAQMNYANRNRPGALAAMPASAFANGRPVATSDLTMNSRAALANARVMPRAAVAPTRASVLAANGRATRNAPPASVLNRQIVAARTPPPAPASFAARQRLLQRAPGQPLSTAQLHTLAAQHPQRGANVRAVANARMLRASNVRGQGSDAIRPATPGRSMVHAPSRVQANRAQTNDRVATGTNRHAPMNAPAAQLRSSGYAHARNERGGANAAVGARAQASTVQRGRAQAAHARVSSNTPASRQQLRSSEFAHARNASGRADNRVATLPQPHRQVPQQRQIDHRMMTATPQNRVVTQPRQQTQTPRHERQIERSNVSRPQSPLVAQQRAAAPQYQRPVQRSAASLAENRVVTQPQHAPTPQYQRPIERTAPAAPMRAEARAAQPHYNAPPPSQPRSGAPQPQRVASSQRQTPRVAADKKKNDKDDNGRR